MKSGKVLCLLAMLAPGVVVASGTTQLANPAAVFCDSNGGEYVIETEADGQRGYCILPDGEKVDAWEHFRLNWDKASSGN